MTCTLAGRRPRGRPRRRWIDSIKEIWHAADHGGAEWQVMAYDREKWEEVVLEVKILNGL